MIDQIPDGLVILFLIVAVLGYASAFVSISKKYKITPRKFEEHIEPDMDISPENRALSIINYEKPTLLSYQIDRPVFLNDDKVGCALYMHSGRWYEGISSSPSFGFKIILQRIENFWSAYIFELRMTNYHPDNYSLFDAQISEMTWKINQSLIEGVECDLSEFFTRWREMDPYFDVSIYSSKDVIVLPEES